MLEKDTSKAGKKKMRYNRRREQKATAMVVICSSITIVSHVPTFVNHTLVNTDFYVTYGQCSKLVQSVAYEIGYIPNFFTYMAFNKEFYDVFMSVWIFVLRKCFFCSRFDAWFDDETKKKADFVASKETVKSNLNNNKK
jgi:hypothetical protein